MNYHKHGLQHSPVVGFVLGQERVEASGAVYPLPNLDDETLQNHLEGVDMRPTPPEKMGRPRDYVHKIQKLLCDFSYHSPLLTTHLLYPSLP